MSNTMRTMRLIGLTVCIGLIGFFIQARAAVIPATISVAATETSATISWQTLQPVPTWIIYGTSPAYGLEYKTDQLTTSHSAVLGQLTPNTVYHFHIRSTDGLSIAPYTTFYTGAADTVAALQEKIRQLSLQLQALNAQEVPMEAVPVLFSKTALKVGDTGADVKLLQELLNKDPRTQVAAFGPGSPGNETMYYGPATARAVAKFQELYRSEVLAPVGLSSGTGFAGTQTLAQLKKLHSASAPAKSSTSGSGVAAVSTPQKSTGQSSGGGSGSGSSVSVAPSGSSSGGSQSGSAGGSGGSVSGAPSSATDTTTAQQDSAKEKTPGTPSNGSGGGAPAVSTKFAIGNRVQTTAPLNVRSVASTGGAVLGTQSLGALGTVVAGPIKATGFVWWNVNYDVGADGWSAEEYLIVAATPAPAPAPTPTPVDDPLPTNDVPPVPPAPTPDPTPTTEPGPTTNRTSVSQFGITWTFDKAYPVGQFANGDYWVTGPVKIISITPKSTDVGGRVMNGSMINPITGAGNTGARQGYDSAMYAQYDKGYYVPSLNVAFNVSASNPLSVSNNSSLISTISFPTAGARPQIDKAAVLTVLPSAPPAGSFRPPYAGTDKTIRFNKSQLRLSALPKLALPTGAPSLTAVEDSIIDPWLDHGYTWLTRYMHSGAIPEYGRDATKVMADASLMLLTNISNKETLATRFTQLAIDLAGVVKNGRVYDDAGGHGHGRLWTIIFGGLLLNDADMASAGSWYKTHTAGQNLFQDQCQHAFVTPEYLTRTLVRADDRAPLEYYTAAHVGLAEWEIRGCEDPEQSNAHPDATYRDIVGSSMVGQILSAHLLNADSLWGDAAIPAYGDRWWSWLNKGETKTLSAFAKNMWKSYRSQAPVTTLFVGGVTPAPAPAPIPLPAPKFSAGDRVQVTQPLNVRSSASTAGSLLGTQAAGSLGTVVSGGTSSGGYIWWNINYDTGADGWSVENYLVATTVPAPTPAPTPVPEPTPTPVPSGNTININGSVSYQTIQGWEADKFALQDDAAFSRFDDVLFDKIATESGITRIRLAVKVGAEHSTDHYAQWQAAGAPSSGAAYDTWRANRYAAVNDNASASSINTSGFHFTELDSDISNIINPLRQRFAAQGKSLYISLNPVGFLGQVTDPALKGLHRDPNEYAEFVLAAFQHIKNKYGWSPDGLEIYLEPMLATYGNGTVTGNSLVAASNRLSAAGFNPDFIASSETNVTSALTAFDLMMQVPGIVGKIDEFSYHTYAGGTITNLQAVASRAAKYGLRTSMLERWNSGNNLQFLFENLKYANNSAYQLGALAGATTAATPMYRIDTSNSSNPTITMSPAARYATMVFKNVPPGSVRVGAASGNVSFDPIAFIRPNGTYAVLIRSTASGVVTLSGLPQGTYGVRYTTASAYDAVGAGVTIGSNGSGTVSIPGTGIVVVTGGSGAAPAPAPTPTPIPEPTPDPVPDPTPDPIPEPTPEPVPDTGTEPAPTTGGTAPAGGLIAHYSFDGNANDSAGSLHGTPLGGLTYGSGKAGQAAVFDGVDDAISLGSRSLANLGISNQFSISAWVRTDSSAKDTQAIFTKGSANSSAAYSAIEFQMTTTSPRPRLRVSNGSSFVSVAGAGEVQSGTWYHLAATYDATTGSAKLYRDGVEIDSDSVGAFAIFDGTSVQKTGIGYDARNNRAFFQGAVDEFRLYNRVLSASEVQSLYSNPTAYQAPDVTGLATVYTITGAPMVADERMIWLIFSLTGITILLWYALQRKRG